MVNPDRNKGNLMKTNRVRSRIASFVIAVVLLFQISPALAGPTEGAGNKDRGRVEITYTKWILTPTSAPLPWLMAGFVNDGPVGSFVGEVLERKVSTNGRITVLEAIYEVVDGDRSFTALVQGGTNNQTGAALLDGVILAGWRTGDRVHVEFQVMTNCLGGPLGRCFQGTIRIGPHGDD
jgi:hypothetical protein